MKNDVLNTCYSIGFKDRIHFDWPDVSAVLAKVTEELNELKSSLNEGRLAQAHELGDLLFTVVQTARHLKLDPSLALEIANDRYLNRVSKMKILIEEQNLRFEDLNLSQLEEFWVKAKVSLKENEKQILKNSFA